MHDELLNINCETGEYEIPKHLDGIFNSHFLEEENL
jgi:hypothetical protein